MKIVLLEKFLCRRKEERIEINKGKMKGKKRRRE